ADGSSRVERIFLRDVAETQKLSRRNDAVIGSDAARDNLEERGFACPIRADETDALALGNGQGKAFEQRTRAERFGNILAAQQQRHRTLNCTVGQVGNLRPIVNRPARAYTYNAAGALPIRRRLPVCPTCFNACRFARRDLPTSQSAWQSR